MKKGLFICAIAGLVIAVSSWMAPKAEAHRFGYRVAATSARVAVRGAHVAKRATYRAAVTPAYRHHYYHSPVHHALPVHYARPVYYPRPIYTPVVPHVYHRSLYARPGIGYGYPY